MQKIIVNTQSIKNELKNFKEKPANGILEYVWNGFDAEADNVHINYSFTQKGAGLSFGYPSLEIADDGTGWDFKNINSANLFLVSPKKYLSYKSLPRGRYGVGRFTFFSFASQAIWETIFDGDKSKIKISADSLDKYEVEETKDKNKGEKGTKVTFIINSEKLTEDFFKNELLSTLKLEFCWFLMLFPNKNIYINGEKVSVESLVGARKNIEETIEGYKFNMHLLQWTKKPTEEYSKYYFLNGKGEENSKKTTGLNNKSDDFYHSAYIKSDFFDDFKYVEEEEKDVSDKQKTNNLFEESTKEKDKKEIFNTLLKKVNQALELMRKPYLKEISSKKIVEWKKIEILPSVNELGVNQKDYEEMIKEIYVVAPQLFTNSSDEQRKIILSLLSSLLSTEEKDLILKIFNQVYNLSEDDKKVLSDILDRTTLSNVVRAIKELDHRLQIISCLEEILFTDKSKDTKEVIHLQKMLDENPWVFGECYRLFASTEGSIRKTLIDFRDKILKKSETLIETKSRKELDIFLVKEETTDNRIDSVIVEIKRPSITLKKKELDQIKDYMSTVLKEPACIGEKMHWVFYLIGNDFDDYIKKEIKNASQRGEESTGLAFYDEDNRAKLYVKKWADIINVEQKSKYKFLQEKLNIKRENLDGKSIDDIVSNNTKKVTKRTVKAGV